MPELRRAHAGGYVAGAKPNMNLARLYSERICPACGYQLDFTPWAADSQFVRPCPCCGLHFGLDDADPVHRAGTYRKWRFQWIGYGKRWWSAKQPADYDPAAQLKRLEQVAEDPDY